MVRLPPEETCRSKRLAALVSRISGSTWTAGSLPLKYISVTWRLHGAFCVLRRVKAPQEAREPR